MRGIISICICLFWLSPCYSQNLTDNQSFKDSLLKRYPIFDINAVSDFNNELARAEVRESVMSNTDTTFFDVKARWNVLFIIDSLESLNVSNMSSNELLYLGSRYEELSFSFPTNREKIKHHRLDSLKTLIALYYYNLSFDKAENRKDVALSFISIANIKLKEHNFDQVYLLLYDDCYSVLDDPHHKLYAIKSAKNYISRGKTVVSKEQAKLILPYAQLYLSLYRDFYPTNYSRLVHEYSDYGYYQYVAGCPEYINSCQMAIDIMEEHEDVQGFFFMVAVLTQSGYSTSPYALMAEHHFALGNLDKAKEYYRKVMIDNNSFYEYTDNYKGIEGHSEIYRLSYSYPKHMLNLARLCNFSKEDDYNKYLTESYLSCVSKLLYTFKTHTAQERQEQFYSYESILTMQYNNEDPVKVFDAALFIKNITTSANIDFDDFFLDSSNIFMKETYEEYKKLSLEYTSSLSQYTYRKIQELEIKLISYSTIYGSYVKSLYYTTNDIQKALNKDTHVIEFVEIRPLDNSPIYYAALLLCKDWDAPKMIHLFETSALEKLVTSDVSKTYSGDQGKEIQKLIWSKIEPYINEGNNIYFSPSGKLHHLAIESLPTEDGRIMSEKYNMYRLSTTKQLCYEQPAKKYTKAVLYGGLVYDLDDETMISQSRAYEQRSAYTMRGFESDTTYRGSWKELPGTKKEVANISYTLAGKKINITVFQEEKGNEESFRTLSGQKYDIIHIATHGFFYPLQEARKRDYFNITNDNIPVVDNAMRRSGLIMSGGNRAWRGEQLPDNIEDGVLTAQEITSLDLRGADLVVLSACETGLGDVSGEGVFGLQRAFKKAGAQTLVMSLWKVSDEATELMMSELYAHLLSGASKREAFLKAQAAVRKKYSEPYYWAAFIMLD